MATLKPFDEEAIIKAAKETGGALVTIEEHSINGGLGATVSQIVCANHPVPPVKTLAFPDEYLVTGNSLELFAIMASMPRASQPQWKHSFPR